MTPRHLKSLQYMIFKTKRTNSVNFWILFDCLKGMLLVEFLHTGLYKFIREKSGIA